MTDEIPVHRVAVVGTGVIGASWTALFLARGFDVVATDPADGAADRLRAAVDRAWGQLSDIGLSPGASRERLRFTTNLVEAVSSADFVQENGPERSDFKIDLMARIDSAAPAECLIASSSSAIMPSVLQSGCKRPQRVLVGHPFNPPHIIPLVEVVGGSTTSPQSLQRAMAFYASIGKRPILLKKEMPGHVANRLQLALYKEVLHLVQQGVVSVAAADDAVSWGPGLRWSVMGPNLQFHLGGGAGGIRHFLDGVFAGLAPLMNSLGEPSITEELKQTIVDGVSEQAGGRTVEQLADAENRLLVKLLRLRDSLDEPSA